MNTIQIPHNAFFLLMGFIVVLLIEANRHGKPIKQNTYNFWSTFFDMAFTLALIYMASKGFFNY